MRGAFAATTVERIGQGRAAMAREVIGGGEDLQRAGDIEQLRHVEGENLDPPWAFWRNLLVICHFRQTIIG